MNIEKTYTTTLEAVSYKDDIQAILYAKLEATSPPRTVDYIGLALDHIDAKVSEIAETIKTLQEMKKHEEARIDHIKEQACVWLESTGIDKLDGLIVSSITINDTKPKENLIITDEVSLIDQGFYRKVLEKTSVKNAILEGNTIEGAHIEIVHVANKIKVNKKRAKINTTE